MARPQIAEIVQTDAPRLTAAEGLRHDDAPADYLADCTVLLADARTAVDAAIAHGFPADGTVLTSSPALRHRLGGSEPLDVRDHGNSSRLQAYSQAMTEMSRSLFTACRAVDDSHTTGVVAARRAVNFFGRVVQKATLLTDDDLVAPRAVVILETGDPTSDALFNAPWASLLRRNPELRLLKVPVTWKPETAATATLLERMRISPYARVYRALHHLCGRLPFLFQRGKVLIASENELLRETAVHMALRGYRLKSLPLPDAKTTTLSAERKARLSNVVQGVLGPVLAQWVPNGLIDELLTLYTDNFFEDLAQQEAQRPFWDRTLSAESGAKPTYLLTNYPKFLNGPALLEACRAHGAPMVAFQHGVAREICAGHDVGAAWYEIACADHVACFNDASVAASQGQIFATGEAFAAGMASEVRRFARYRKPKPGRPSLIYVSTNLYAGNRQMPMGAQTDIEKAQHEIELTEQVLGRLPHKVLFKTYPEPRYFDENPVERVADAQPNIELFNRKTDLRFLLPDARVLITSRATSTVSICVLSGIPLVFIDDPEQFPLNPDARRAFEAGVFLFDAGAADFHDRMRTFLSQPLETIERQWQDKASARKELIRAFFSSTDDRAGRTAARHLLSLKLPTPMENTDRV
jgi:hypothetical protein